MAKKNPTIPTIEEIVARAMRDELITAEVVALLGDLESRARARAAQLRNCAASDAALLTAYTDWLSSRTERSAVELSALLLVRARSAEQRKRRAARLACAAQAQAAQAAQAAAQARRATIAFAIVASVVAIAIAVAITLL